MAVEKGDTFQGQRLERKLTDLKEGMIAVMKEFEGEALVAN